MNALLAAQEKFKRESGVKIPPLWTFLLRNSFKYIDLNLRSYLHKRLDINIIKYETFEFDTSEFELSEDYYSALSAFPMNKNLFIQIKNKDFNSLLSVMHGGSGEHIDHQLSNLSKKQMEPIINSIQDGFNKALKDNDRNLEFKLQQNIEFNQYIGIRVEIQIGFDKIYLLIPQDFFKLHSVE